MEMLGDVNLHDRSMIAPLFRLMKSFFFFGKRLMKSCVMQLSKINKVSIYENSRFNTRLRQGLFSLGQGKGAES